MLPNTKPVRVAYSFPHKLGAQRICYAAWQHVEGLAASGAEVTALPGVLHRPLSSSVKVRPTLSKGKLRIPYRLFGRIGSGKLHDWIVARRLPQMVGQIDLIHTFPLGSLQTLKTARKLGIPTVLERCNAHTAFAYRVVSEECQRIGVTMPPGHEHDYDAAILRREEAEYREADYLLCPSKFVARTFRDEGFSDEHLARFQYGYDPESCYPSTQPREEKQGLTVLFAAGCAPRKGLHFALEAWLQSTAHQHGTLMIAGEFIPGYAEKLAPMLAHPSVKRIGFRKDLHDVMRSCDVMVLPSIEEGSALVTYDARGCGCVLAVSDATGAVCTHMENALVHTAGDVKTLAEHLSKLDSDRALLRQLREASLRTAGELTWRAAGVKMHEEYRSILARKQASVNSVRAREAALS
jgi:glycosyltransferase involved in cell wall biosynthesis